MENLSTPCNKQKCWHVCSRAALWSIYTRYVIVSQGQVSVCGDQTIKYPWVGSGWYHHFSVHSKRHSFQSPVHLYPIKNVHNITEHKCNRLVAQSVLFCLSSVEGAANCSLKTWNVLGVQRRCQNKLVTSGRTDPSGQNSWPVICSGPKKLIGDRHTYLSSKCNTRVTWIYDSSSLIAWKGESDNVAFICSQRACQFFFPLTCKSINLRPSLLHSGLRNYLHQPPVKWLINSCLTARIVYTRLPIGNLHSKW